MAVAVWAVLESRAAHRGGSFFRGLLTFAAICVALPVARHAVRLRRSPQRCGRMAELVRRAHRLHVARRHHHLARRTAISFTGRGLGGIGFAQASAEWWRYNAADNLMIYLLVSFGLFAILYVGGFC